MTYKYWHTFDFPEFQTTGLDNSPEKLKFIKGQVVVNINGSNIAVSIQEFLEPNKYNLKN